MANEKRLIDADALDALEELEYDYAPVRDGCAWYRAADVWSCIENQPTVDAVEVVRCKECKHMEVTPDCLRWCHVWNGINGMGDEGFCNYGERKDNG